MEMLIGSIDFAENRRLSGYSSGGEIYFSVGERFFPAEHWYDTAFLDLKTWLPGLISFGSDHTDSCVLSFMDGPYTIWINRGENGCICSDFFRDRKIICSEQNVDLQVLIRSALSCCRKYDRFLFENGKPHQFTDECRILKTILDT